MFMHLIEQIYSSPMTLTANLLITHLFYPKKTPTICNLYITLLCLPLLHPNIIAYEATVSYYHLPSMFVPSNIAH